MFVVGRPSGDRHSTGSSITLLSGDVKKRFKKSNFGDYRNLIEQQLGNSLTIWSYKRRDGWFRSQNSIIEMEINGRRLWNNWPEIKQNIEAGNPGKWFIFGLLLAISPFYKIWKLLTKKTNSD